MCVCVCCECRVFIGRLQAEDHVRISNRIIRMNYGLFIVLFLIAMLYFVIFIIAVVYLFSFVFYSLLFARMCVYVSISSCYVWNEASGKKNYHLCDVPWYALHFHSDTYWYFMYHFSVSSLLWLTLCVINVRHGGRGEWYCGYLYIGVDVWNQFRQRITIDNICLIFFV